MRPLNLLLLGVLLLNGPRADTDNRNQPSFKAQPDRGKAVITLADIPCFTVIGSLGGLNPLERAEVIADRLNRLAKEPEIKVENFVPSVEKGTIVVLYQEGEKSISLLTVDAKTARSVSGSHKSRIRLAQWWTALLRDMFLLLRNQPPFYTTQTSFGQLLQEAYQRYQEKKLESFFQAWQENLALYKKKVATLTLTIPENFGPEILAEKPLVSAKETPQEERSKTSPEEKPSKTDEGRKTSLRVRVPSRLKETLQITLQEGQLSVQWNQGDNLAALNVILLGERGQTLQKRATVSPPWEVKLPFPPDTHTVEVTLLFEDGKETVYELPVEREQGSS